jgi:flavin-dependent thymidylate synthase
MPETNNRVILIGHYGGDITHACSGWTSTERELTEDKRARLHKFLADLAKAGHHSPYEKSTLHFLVNTDIASHIHLLKHRIGVSINAESARYKELKEDKYYLPSDWYYIKANTWALDATTNQTWIQTLVKYTEIGNKLYHDCVKDLTPVLGRKRAKESARFFKTYNSQIEADVMFNWRSFAHFQSLRNSPDAQREIRIIAQMMLLLVKNIPGNPFATTIESFGLDGAEFYSELSDAS